MRVKRYEIQRTSSGWLAYAFVNVLTSARYSAVSTHALGRSRWLWLAAWKAARAALRNGRAAEAFHRPGRLRRGW